MITEPYLCKGVYYPIRDLIDMRVVLKDGFGDARNIICHARGCLIAELNRMGFEFNDYHGENIFSDVFVDKETKRITEFLNGD